MLPHLKTTKITDVQTSPSLFGIKRKIYKSQLGFTSLSQMPRSRLQFLILQFSIITNECHPVSTFNPPVSIHPLSVLVHLVLHFFYEFLFFSFCRRFCAILGVFYLATSLFILNKSYFILLYGLFVLFFLVTDLLIMILFINYR